MVLLRSGPGLALNLVALIVMLILSAPVTANTFPADRWPISTPEEQGLSSQKLVELVERIQRDSLHVDSVLIVRNGRLVMDAYFWPFAKGQKHIIHSCTKSVMSALVGIAIDKGFIKGVHQPVSDFFPGKTFQHMDDLKKSMTLEDLLMMASGLECRDSYRHLWVGLRRMRQSLDWAQYVMDLPMAEPPGEKFEYCNGVSHLLSVIIQRTTKTRTVDFAKEHLFGPLGITDIGWQTSPLGIDVGYGQMRLTPHDMARFGWLFLNNGLWDGKRIVSRSWVEISTSPLIKATIFDHYGYQWWVDSSGYYAAVGYKGQRIFVIPDRNMVVVMTGDLTGRAGLLPKKLLETYIIPAAVSPGPLSPAPQTLRRLGELLTTLSLKPVQGYTWKNEAAGLAKDGLFKRTAFPGFSFEYPPGSRKSGLLFPFQVMRMEALGDVDIAAAVMEVPQDVPLEEFGPKAYVAQMEQFGSKVRIEAHRKVKLRCGTTAWVTEFTWLFRGRLPLITRMIATYKADKCIFVDAHSDRDHFHFDSMVDSLEFE